MANEEHLLIPNKGANSWNGWRNEHPNIIPDLKGVNLSDEDLSECNFSYISDDGCGMDKEIIDKIFEPFFTSKGVGKYQNADDNNYAASR